MGASSITEQYAIDILNSEGVLNRLKVAPQKIEKGDLYLINDRMLLILLPLDQGMVEAHIAQPRKEWKHIHDDINESLIFIQGLGYNQVYTNVRSELKTTLNLLLKHGFEKIDQIENEVILRWESKQHY